MSAIPPRPDLPQDPAFLYARIHQPATGCTISASLMVATTCMDVSIVPSVRLSDLGSA